LISSSLNLTSAFWKQKIPYIFSGYSGTTIQIRPILRFSNGCGFCMTAATRGPEWCQNIGRDRPHHIAPSGYSINAVAAALTVEIWYKKFLLDEHEDKSLKFSMKDYSVRLEKLRKLQSCPICANDSE
jgi:hypothetical protein